MYKGDVSGICARCGAHIKHLYDFKGKTYGSTCVEAVSGISPKDWVKIDGRFDEQATRQSLVDRERNRQELDTLRKTLELVRKTQQKGTDSARILLAIAMEEYEGSV